MYSWKDHSFKFYWDGMFWRDVEGDIAPAEAADDLEKEHPEAKADFKALPWDRQFTIGGRSYGYSFDTDAFTDLKRFTEPTNEHDMELRKFLAVGTKTALLGPDPRL